MMKIKKMVIALLFIGLVTPITQALEFYNVNNTIEFYLKIDSTVSLSETEADQKNGAIWDRLCLITYFKQGKIIAIDALNSPKDFMLAKKAILQG